MAPSKRMSWLPPLFVFSVVSLMYGVYLLLHLLPQLRRLNWLQPVPSTGVAPRHTGPLPSDPHMPMTSAAEVVGLALAFHGAFLLFLASYFQAMATPPGAVPKGDPRWERGAFDIDPEEDREVERIIRDQSVDLTQPSIRSLLKRMEVVERKKGKPLRSDEEAPLALDPDDLKRKCHGCMVYKPDRVHHCQVCGQCVLRMDHHCPWIANCVGFRNYKFFLLVLVYAVLSMAFLLASLLPRFLAVFQPILDMGYFLRRDLLIAVVFVTAAALFLVLGAFLCFHLYLSASAMSTIEYREKRSSADPAIQHRWAVAHVKYARGSAYQNLRHVLGEPYMWLFPVEPWPSDDGTYTRPLPDDGDSANAPKAL